jgi:hypothetical protein
MKRIAENQTGRIGDVSMLAGPQMVEGFGNANRRTYFIQL